MSQALVEKIDKSRKFNQGYATVEYLAAPILDMDLHTRPDGVFDPATFERDGSPASVCLIEIALRHRLPQFDHSVWQRQLLGRLLQLPLVRCNGGGHMESLPRGRWTLGQGRREALPRR
jgi:hypothetical protein